MTASPPFKLGSSVTVKKLRCAGIIVEVLSSGRYRVALGAMTFVCSFDDLTVANSPSKDPTPKSETQNRSPIRSQGPPPPSTIDLHGLTVADAVSRLEAWLDRVVLSELSHVKVIHGLGSGKVQRGVHAFLAKLHVIRSYKINDRNPGETDIYL